MKSYREIFRSSAIIGSSSVINIAISIIRVKVLAVLLGPAGIGLLGVYQSIVGVATTVAGCGLGASGVRQLAASGDDAEVLEVVRRALLASNLLLGLIGMLVVWLVRDVIAEVIFEGAIQVNDVGWLGLGVLLSLIAASQTTLLQGLRRIGDLARVSVLSAVLTTVVGILCVYILGEAGVLWFVISSPAISIVVATYFAKRLPPPKEQYDWRRIQLQCQVMIKFGVPVMLGGLMNVGTQLFVLSLVIADMGIEAGGHFQASWAISITYVGFILAAMGTDYLPRLTAVIHSHEKAAQLVNEQGEMALLLGGAVILAMITMAPLVIYVLYSSEFEPAGEVLRWQMLGSVMKLIGWPMGFVVLAAGRGGLIIYTQFVWNAVFILCLYFLLEELGLLAIGVSFCVAYIVGSLNVWFVANKLIGIVPTRLNLALTFSILVGGSLIIFLADISPVWSLWIGLLITAAVAIVSVKRLDFLIDVSGWLKSKFG